MFKSIYYYKPNLEEVIRRFQSMYETKGPGQVAAYAIPPAPVGEPVPTLNQIDFNSNEDVKKYLDVCLYNYELYIDYTPG